MNLPKTYQPDQYEPNIYGLWETSNSFRPSGVGEPYSIILPPPNANGNLHIGHGLTVALQDTLVRWQRMKGKDTLYLPGADHAGFETWVVYEKELQKQGKSRFDFSREQLYSKVWDFVDKQRGNMELQLRALGASLSWEHMVFTLDEKVVQTTYNTFKQLWDKGLIYRGEKMVNYCTTHQTGFADIEINHKNEKSKLWKIAYPSLDKVTEIIVATTRPETMLGDVAVAVHPDDERYKHLIGTTVQLPLADREIPVIADEYVDPNFGTGAVKITPAHDPNDFEIGERHNLPRIQVIGFDGKMTNVPSQFAGLEVLDARKRILAALEAADFRRGEETLENSIAHCYKCNTIIQPLVKDQWFLKTQPLAKRVIDIINSGEVKFYPESRTKALLYYLENLRDWNLSRQIAWGIPIPAFQNTADANDWVFDTRVDQKSIEIDGKVYRREEDTFDTWFSSGQWPFITTDFLDGGELSRFYPSNVMETGHDILYPWVSRMLMLGLEVTDKLPFKDVYLHGLVNDAHGKKMSKSKGNVINPMDMVSKYGSDAFRMGIMASRSAGQDQAFSEAKVIAGRNFCNKLWNTARFIESKLLDMYKSSEPTPISLADHWIIRELNNSIKSIDELLSQYRFAEAAEVVYHSLWDNLADWYIESSKAELNHDVLVWALDVTLRISHPFAPFVTETIWQTLPWYNEQLIIADWPTHVNFDEISASQFDRLKNFITEVRFVANELPGNEKYDLLYGNDSLISENLELVKHLVGFYIKSIDHTDQPRGLRIASEGREVWFDIDKNTLNDHQSNLEVRLSKEHFRAKSLRKRLENSSYIEKAPPQLVEESQKELREITERINKLQEELKVIDSSN
ncbi:valine--tRNA ligase [Candidatus Saccharibacteria bacterium]|nr:valine--tRNA ligase [Candidatus Saccharibacteria bacterium]